MKPITVNQALNLSASIVESVNRHLKTNGYGTDMNIDGVIAGAIPNPFNWHSLIGQTENPWMVMNNVRDRIIDYVEGNPSRSSGALLRSMQKIDLGIGEEGDQHNVLQFIRDVINIRRSDVMTETPGMATRCRYTEGETKTRSNKELPTVVNYTANSIVGESERRMYTASKPSIDIEMVYTVWVNQILKALSLKLLMVKSCISDDKEREVTLENVLTSLIKLNEKIKEETKPVTGHVRALSRAVRSVFRDHNQRKQLPDDFENLIQGLNTCRVYDLGGTYENNRQIALREKMDKFNTMFSETPLTNKEEIGSKAGLVKTKLNKREIKAAPLASQAIRVQFKNLRWKSPILKRAVDQLLCIIDMQLPSMPAHNVELLARSIVNINTRASLGMPIRVLVDKAWRALRKTFNCYYGTKDHPEEIKTLLEAFFSCAVMGVKEEKCLTGKYKEMRETFLRYNELYSK